MSYAKEQLEKYESQLKKFDEQISSAESEMERAHLESEKETLVTQNEADVWEYNDIISLQNKTKEQMEKINGELDVLRDKRAQLDERLASPDITENERKKYQLYQTFNDEQTELAQAKLAAFEIKVSYAEMREHKKQQEDENKMLWEKVSSMEYGTAEWRETRALLDTKEEDLNAIKITFNEKVAQFREMSVGVNEKQYELAQTRIQRLEDAKHQFKPEELEQAEVRIKEFQVDAEQALQHKQMNEKSAAHYRDVAFNLAMGNQATTNKTINMKNTVEEEASKEETASNETVKVTEEPSVIENTEPAAEGEIKEQPSVETIEEQEKEDSFAVAYMKEQKQRTEELLQQTGDEKTKEYLIWNSKRLSHEMEGKHFDEPCPDVAMHTMTLYQELADHEQILNGEVSAAERQGRETLIQIRNKQFDEIDVLQIAESKKMQAKEKKQQLFESSKPQVEKFEMKENSKEHLVEKQTKRQKFGERAVTFARAVGRVTEAAADYTVGKTANLAGKVGGLATGLGAGYVVGGAIVAAAGAPGLATLAVAGIAAYGAGKLASNLGNKLSHGIVQTTGNVAIAAVKASVASIGALKEVKQSRKKAIAEREKAFKAKAIAEFQALKKVVNSVDIEKDGYEAAYHVAKHGVDFMEKAKNSPECKPPKRLAAAAESLAACTARWKKVFVEKVTHKTKTVQKDTAFSR
ncbi:hypothetical protein [Aneurinibacillus tyrosinisolvens]|uniref:hypothetical protein n=1 Tax=Aneurinibacillus tyrosinisolvens TaxID=1443435 RepID=UPI00063F231B|nr:hypothetical protein [Aneurinibacillus tyrosinisolvens]